MHIPKRQQEWMSRRGDGTVCAGLRLWSALRFAIAFTRLSSALRFTIAITKREISFSGRWLDGRLCHELIGSMINKVGAVTGKG